MPAHSLPDRPRGFLIPIGGAEDKIGDSKILKRFVRLCGRRPSIAIIPTASRRDDAGRNYQELFGDFDASDPQILQFARREDCESEAALKILSECDGVFITGGD
mgnify:CR=1 FL=1